MCDVAERSNTHSWWMWEWRGQRSFSPLLIKVGVFSVHYTPTHTHTHTQTQTHTNTPFIEWVFDNKNTGQAHFYFPTYLHFCCVHVCAYLCLLVSELVASNEVNLLCGAKTSVCLYLCYMGRGLFSSLSTPLSLSTLSHTLPPLLQTYSTCFCSYWLTI